MISDFHNEIVEYIKNTDYDEDIKEFLIRSYVTETDIGETDSFAYKRIYDNLISHYINQR